MTSSELDGLLDGKVSRFSALEKLSDVYPCLLSRVMEKFLP